jgi:hypothetical protein
MLVEKKSGSPACWSLVHRIQGLIQLDWEIIIQHSYREANRCADILANLGCNLGLPLIFCESCPAQVSLMFAADLIGVTTPPLIAM